MFSGEGEVNLENVELYHLAKFVHGFQVQCRGCEFEKSQISMPNLLFFVNGYGARPVEQLATIRFDTFFFNV